MNIEILRKIYKNYKKNSTKKIIINATYILLRSMNNMNIYIHSFIIYIYIYIILNYYVYLNKNIYIKNNYLLFNTLYIVYK